MHTKGIAARGSWPYYQEQEATFGAPGRTTSSKEAISNKCIASSNKCLTSSNKDASSSKKLLGALVPGCFRFPPFIKSAPSMKYRPLVNYLQKRLKLMFKVKGSAE